MLIVGVVLAHQDKPVLVLFFDRNNAPEALDIGTRAFGVGDYDVPLAEYAFRRAIAIDPSLLMAHYQLARVLFVEGRSADAEAEINQELHYHPENLRSLYVRGLIYAYTGNLPGAEEDFKRFVAWVPTEWAGYNDLAWVLAQEGKYREAKSVLMDAFQTAHGADTNPWLWNNLGVQELNLAEYSAAVISFEKARVLAGALDEKTWHAAYPGNDPSGSVGGIKAFQEAVETNLAKAQSSAS